MSGRRRRRPLRELSIHQRAGGVNAGDVVLCKRLLTAVAVQLLFGEEEEAEDLDGTVFMLLSAWSSLTTERRIQRPYFAPIRRTIAS